MTDEPPPEMFGTPRHPLWRRVRALWLREHPSCAACGGTEALEVHHLRPYHLFPELELDPANLLSLCDAPSRSCHRRVGHAYRWDLWVPTARQDAARQLSSVASARDTRDETPPIPFVESTVPKPEPQAAKEIWPLYWQLWGSDPGAETYNAETWKALREALEGGLSGGLFRSGAFTLASGAVSDFKIDCDALGPGDWEALASLAAKRLPPFSEVLGVPRGGLRFAEALEAHRTEGADVLLLAEDVVTTGGSITKFRDGLPPSGHRVLGVCVFARGAWPDWVRPLYADWQAVYEGRLRGLEARLASLELHHVRFKGQSPEPPPPGG